jgi:hypothetical protein
MVRSQGCSAKSGAGDKVRDGVNSQHDKFVGEQSAGTTRERNGTRPLAAAQAGKERLDQNRPRGLLRFIVTWDEARVASARNKGSAGGTREFQESLQILFLRSP